MESLLGADRGPTISQRRTRVLTHFSRNSIVGSLVPQYSMNRDSGWRGMALLSSLSLKPLRVLGPPLAHAGRRRQRSGMGIFHGM